MDTLNALKARAYDLLASIQKLDAELKDVNNQIVEETQRIQEEKKKDKK